MKASSIFLVCVLLCGCGSNPVTTWSAQFRSPDGGWDALARSENWAGPGNNYVATTVSIKQVNTAQEPVQVLVFDRDFDSMNLKMEWLTSTHFRVVYGEKDPRDHITVLFQAVRCFGSIEISLQYAGLARVQDFN